MEWINELYYNISGRFYIIGEEETMTFSWCLIASFQYSRSQLKWYLLREQPFQVILNKQASPIIIYLHNLFNSSKVISKTDIYFTCLSPTFWTLGSMRGGTMWVLLNCRQNSSWHGVSTQ